MTHGRLHDLIAGTSATTGHRVVISVKDMDGLSRGLGIPIDDLVATLFPRSKRPRDAVTGDERAILDLYRSMSPDQQRLWSAIGHTIRQAAPGSPRPVP